MREGALIEAAQDAEERVLRVAKGLCYNLHTLQLNDQHFTKCRRMRHDFETDCELTATH